MKILERRWPRSTFTSFIVLRHDGRISFEDTISATTVEISIHKDKEAIPEYGTAPESFAKPLSCAKKLGHSLSFVGGWSFNAAEIPFHLPSAALRLHSSSHAPPSRNVLYPRATSHMQQRR